MMKDLRNAHASSLSLAAVSGRCPCCNKGRVFSGFLNVAPCCDVCGLDLSFADAGDGPAVFVIFIVGFIIVAAALGVELVFQPPYWLHMAIWFPSIILISLVLLRPIKGLMIALQYRNKACEGRLDD